MSKKEIIVNYSGKKYDFNIEIGETPKNIGVANIRSKILTDSDTYLNFINLTSKLNFPGGFIIRKNTDSGRFFKIRFDDDKKAINYLAGYFILVGKELKSGKADILVKKLFDGKEPSDYLSENLGPVPKYRSGDAASGSKSKSRTGSTSDDEDRGRSKTVTKSKKKGSSRSRSRSRSRGRDKSKSPQKKVTSGLDSRLSYFDYDELERNIINKLKTNTIFTLDIDGMKLKCAFFYFNKQEDQHVITYINTAGKEAKFRIKDTNISYDDDEDKIIIKGKYIDNKTNNQEIIIELENDLTCKAKLNGDIVSLIKKLTKQIPSVKILEDICKNILSQISNNKHESFNGNVFFYYKENFDFFLRCDDDACYIENKQKDKSAGFFIKDYITNGERTYRKLEDGKLMLINCFILPSDIEPLAKSKHFGDITLYKYDKDTLELTTKEIFLGKNKVLFGDKNNLIKYRLERKDISDNYLEEKIKINSEYNLHVRYYKGVIEKDKKNVEIYGVFYVPIEGSDNEKIRPSAKKEEKKEKKKEEEKRVSDIEIDFDEEEEEEEEEEDEGTDIDETEIESD